MTNTQIWNRGVNKKKNQQLRFIVKKILAELNLVEKSTIHLVQKWKEHFYDIVAISHYCKTRSID